MSWTCEVRTPTITVGEKFDLVCRGDAIALKPEGLHLVLPKEQQYVLRILEAKKIESTGAEFIATSYVAGDKPHELTKAQLSDGTVQVDLQGIRFEVKSVIDPQNPPQEPYGPWGPVALAFPWWLWVSLAFVVVLMASLIFWRGRKIWQRRALIRKLKEHNTALSPIQQFNKDLRQFSRDFPLLTASKWTEEAADRYISRLDEIYRWYLVRKFLIPAFEWGNLSILSELKRRYPKVHKECSAELKIVLRELLAAKALKGKVRLEDGAQLLELCRKSSDHLEAAGVKR